MSNQHAARGTTRLPSVRLAAAHRHECQSAIGHAFAARAVSRGEEGGGGGDEGGGGEGSVGGGESGVGEGGLGGGGSDEGGKIDVGAACPLVAL